MSSPAEVEVRLEVEPRWPLRLPLHGGPDGLTRVRRGVLHRLVHVEDQPVVVRAVALSGGSVLFGAQAAHRSSAERGIARMRQALGVDHDLAPFHNRFRDDPLIGAAVRRDPTVRVRGRPDAFEALAWAICEQLIEFERAAAIERRIVARLGRRCPRTALRDAPSAATLAGTAPACLASFDLAPARAMTLIRAAREVARGRVDLDADDHEHGWRRLRAIPGIGPWTLQMLGSTGQGRLDQLPAGDVGYLKLVGRLLTGDPRARVGEEDVTRFFAPYAPWQALAGAYAFRVRAVAPVAMPQAA